MDINIEQGELQKQSLFKNKWVIIGIILFTLIIVAAVAAFFILLKKENAAPIVPSLDIHSPAPETTDELPDISANDVNVEENIKLENSEKVAEEIKGWQNVGQPGFTLNRASEVSIRFNKKDNLFYVAFKDEKISNHGKVTVKKFDGKEWQLVGSPEFTPKNAYFVDMEINPSDGQPYVIFNEDLGEGSHSREDGGSWVMKFNGSQWEIVGGKPFDSASINNLSMSFNPASNHLYVAYDKNMYLNIKKFDGKEWKDLGKDIAFRESDAQNYNSSNIVFDPETNQPWIAYSDKADPGKIYIMRWENSGHWKKNIITASTKGFINDISLALNPASKQIFLAYNSMSGNSYKLNVFKFNGTGLEPVGSNVYKTGAVSLTSKLVFNTISREPFIAYSTTSNPEKVSIMKFSNGSWNVVGSPHFSGGEASYIDMDFDNSGIPYAAYMDFGNGAKLTVMKFIE
jgi:hypothetical protein